MPNKKGLLNIMKENNFKGWAQRSRV